MRDLKCDFCSAPEPRWDCPARSFDSGVPDPGLPGVTHVSDGGWAACDVCVELVRNGKRGLLVDRAMRETMRRLRENGSPLRRHEIPVLTRALVDLHDSFWRNREGPPREMTAGDLEEARAMPQSFIGSLASAGVERRPMPEWVAEIIGGRAL